MFGLVKKLFKNPLNILKLPFDIAKSAVKNPLGFALTAGTILGTGGLAAPAALGPLSLVGKVMNGLNVIKGVINSKGDPGKILNIVAQELITPKTPFAEANQIVNLTKGFANNPTSIFKQPATLLLPELQALMPKPMLPIASSFMPPVNTNSIIAPTRTGISA